MNNKEFIKKFIKFCEEIDEAELENHRFSALLSNNNAEKIEFSISEAIKLFEIKLRMEGKIR